MILPVATSKLANKHLVPWRLYSCSWRSTVPCSHRKRGMEAFKRLDRALLVGDSQMNALFVQRERFGVVLANSPNLRVEDLRLFGPLVV